MLRRFSIDFAVFSICLDAVLVLLSLAAAVIFRPSLSVLPIVAGIPRPYSIPGYLYPLFPLLWGLALLFASVYDGRRNLRFWKELASLAFGSALAFILQAGVLFITFRDLSRFLFVTYAGLAFGLLVVWRILYRLAYYFRILKSVQPRNVLIVGGGVLGLEVQKQVTFYQDLGLHLVGFLDDDPKKRQAQAKILGTLEDAVNIVLQDDVDDVVIALPPRAHSKVFRLVSEMHTLPVKVWMIPDYFNLALYRTAIEEFAGLPMLDLRAPALTDAQRMVKRGFDLVIVLLFLPVILLLMGIIAVAIRLEGKGPIIFHQPRVGENGRIFHMLKFRTMIPNAERLRPMVEQVDEDGHMIHKRSDDPRVTRIGHILRRTSLDELPQVFNILKGEMSLVGPRPELPYLVEKYEAWQHRRFTVPQGLTGWWQVNGRSEKPMHLHTEDDLYYIQHYSVFLDILILFKTIGAVLQGKGAF